MGIQILIPLCFWNFWADAEANFWYLVTDRLQAMHSEWGRLGQSILRLFIYKK